MMIGPEEDRGGGDWLTPRRHDAQEPAPVRLGSLSQLALDRIGAAPKLHPGQEVSCKPS
jgi:hypothetical protein